MRGRLASLTMVALLVTSAYAFGQEVLDDVIVMKNGDVYRGIIVENKINDYMRIELAGGSVFQLSYDDIDVVRREPQRGSSTEDGQPITFHPGGFFSVPYYLYNGTEYRQQMFGAYSGLVDKLSSDVVVDTEFTRLAEAYRARIEAADFMVLVGFGTVITGALITQAADTAAEQTTGLTLQISGIVVEIIGVLMRTAGPEEIVVGYNEGRW